MGCIASKRAVSTASPAFEYSTAVTVNSNDNRSGSLGGASLGRNSVKNLSGVFNFTGNINHEEEELDDGDREGRKLRKESFNGRGSFGLRVGVSRRHVEAEQSAAGWPTWLSAVAGEAIHGWVPLRADSFEKLEKIGQGTYSSVFRAREVDSGRMVALKKVHFDNFQPESVRFMAREIMILRRLDHPNIMKLEGLITSRLSCSIYLVFEYMEHDLTGLLSCPDIKFSASQVKCYMKQLLSGVEHCHLRGVMHRDIKASNILVNNEGLLKLADFGLANTITSRNRQPLTSRVVTLWYRPPELLMGSTKYGATVDLWSVGCVFAELLSGKPILKGRTEVEQLHKIFKLCGSPPDEYWKKSKLPLATMFKPQHTYESCLLERCKDFHSTAVNLIETLLSIEPHKRGTASSALMSEYFNSKPYPCEPSSLPKYPPNKEIDAKSRDEARRKKAGSKSRESRTARKPRRVHKASQEPKGCSKVALKEEAQDNSQFCLGKYVTDAHNGKTDSISEISEVTNESQGNIFFSGTGITPSSTFAWSKRQKGDSASTISYLRSSLRSQVSELDSSNVSFAKSTLGLTEKENENVSNGVDIGSRGHDDYKIKAMWKQRNQCDLGESFGSFHSRDLSVVHQKEELAAFRKNLDQGQRNEFSGPLLPQSTGIDELLQRKERHIHRAVHRSRFDGDT